MLRKASAGGSGDSEGRWNSGSTRAQSFAELYEAAVDSALVVNSEKSVYNYSLQFAKSHSLGRDWSNRAFRSVYKHKLNSLLFNLNNDKNPEFLTHVRNRNIEGQGVGVPAAARHLAREVEGDL